MTLSARLAKEQTTEQATSNVARLVRLVTRDRIIVGQIRPNVSMRLVDYLNIQTRTTVPIETVMPSAGQEAAMLMRIDRVLYVVPSEQELNVPPREPTLVVNKVPRRVRFGLGPFDVEGEVFLPLASEVEVRGLIANSRDRFFVVRNATLRSVGREEVTKQHSLIFANRAQVDYIATPL